MKTKLLTLAAVIGISQLASGGIGFAGFKGNFTTDSLYHVKAASAKAPAVAGIANPGRRKVRATTKTSSDRQSRLHRLVAGR